MKNILLICLIFSLVNICQMIDTENGFIISQPLFIASNQKIENFNQKIIVNAEELMNEVIKQNVKQPQKIIIYEIETPLYKRGLLSYLRANQKKFSNLFLIEQKIFSNSNKAATLSYFNDNLAIQNFGKLGKEYKQYTHSLSELPFSKIHQQSLNAEYSTIEKVISTFNDLEEIDKLLQSDLQFLEKQNQRYYLFINFKYEQFSSNFALNELIKEEKRAKYKFVDAAQQYEYSRQLEDDEHEDTKQIESLVETNSESSATQAIGIPGYVFSGYLLGLLGIATVLIAVVALYEIKTPTKFARQNLNFGKEY